MPNAPTDDDKPRILQPGLGLPPFIKSVGAGLKGAPGLSGAGLGRPGRVRIPGLFEFLEMGSPRLALARAMGVPFAPWMVSCTATFTSTSPSLQPDVGADTKFSQDQWVDAAIAKVISQNTPLNPFSTMSDFFQNWQNGIQVKLFADGSPRYDVIPRFTQLGNAFDVTNPTWLGDWVLTYNQQLTMDFQTTFALPDTAVPLLVQCTFRCWGPIGEQFSRMTNDEAMTRLLQDYGIECNEDYCKYGCR